MQISPVSWLVAAGALLLFTGCEDIQAVALNPPSPVQPSDSSSSPLPDDDLELRTLREKNDRLIALRMAKLAERRRLKEIVSNNNEDNQRLASQIQNVRDRINEYARRIKHLNDDIRFRRYLLEHPSEPNAPSPSN